MHTDQLFELVYILLEKKKVTAGEMARHFGVSARTVYRWVEALNMADVPVYAEKGKGGGIRIAENYAIDKAVLTEREKLDVLAGIRTLSTLSLENASGSGGKNDGTENSSIQSAITKIQSLFRTGAEKTDWIQVDFAPWNPKGAEVRTLFAQLKNAILSQRQIRFDYFSSAGKCGTRTVQPQKLIFRGQAWYLYGLSSQNEPENPADKEKSLADKKNRMRFFKLNRMRNITVLNVPVLPDAFEGLSDETAGTYDETGEIPFVRLTLKVSKSAAYRIMDEYSVESIEDTEDGAKIITLSLPEIY